jgi:hypothetical protein
LLEPIADLLDHLIKRVQSQVWHRLFAQFLAIDVLLGSVRTVTLRCISAARSRLVASTAVRLLKRA